MELNKTFIDGLWSKEINVTSFVQTNITPYVGDASFLQGPTDRTKHIWNLCLKALEEERANNGVRSLDNKTVSTITSHKAGYIDKEQELIVGLQTDQLLKRAIKPFGGINVVSRACKENGVDVDEKVKDIFTHYRKTHNDGVFDVYTEEIRSFRSLGFLTGLPDNYARGRIIGDYRRLALYGTDRLIEAKTEDLRGLTGPMTDARIRLREEVAEQIKALKEIRTMGEYYGLDLSRPAHSAQEAVQWVYMAYLAAVKEQDGAAMSLGNVSSFLDIFIEYDLAHGNIDEVFAQELIDQFVIKLRMVRHLRMQSYNDIFAGDPTWVTEAIGGRFNDGRTKVTKTSFRFLQTLYNLGPSPEPNLTILWSPDLPQGFKDFCAKVSADTSSIQYENDELMREVRHSDDYGIACCVSYQDIGRQIQFFGARCNLAKALLLAHQRRPLREHRHADGQRHSGAHRGSAALRRGDVQLQDGADRNRPRLQRGNEHHPLHARQILLREGPDGAGGHRPAHQPRLRRGRSLDRPRLALGHQIRQGDGAPQRAGAHRRIRHRG